MTLEEYTSELDGTAAYRIRQCGWEWAAEEEKHWFPDRSMDDVRAAFKALRERI